MKILFSAHFTCSFDLIITPYALSKNVFTRTNHGSPLSLINWHQGQKRGTGFVPMPLFVIFVNQV